jgi:hypothetical protein
MRILYHLPLDPGSRKVRLMLAEKKLPFELKAEQIWERRESFLRLNPAGEVPVLVEEDGTVLPDHRSSPSTSRSAIPSSRCSAATRSSARRRGASRTGSTASSPARSRSCCSRRS